MVIGLSNGLKRQLISCGSLGGVITGGEKRPDTFDLEEAFNGTNKAILDATPSMGILNRGQKMDRQLDEQPRCRLWLRQLLHRGDTAS